MTEFNDPPQCAACGFTLCDLEEMNFGPHRGELLCDECWNASEHYQWKAAKEIIVACIYGIALIMSLAIIGYWLNAWWT